MDTDGFAEAMDYLKDEGVTAHSPEDDHSPEASPEETEATQEETPDPKEAPEDDQAEQDPEDSAEGDHPSEDDHDWRSRYSNLRTHSREQAEKLKEMESKIEQQREEFENRIRQENEQRQMREQQSYAEMQQQQVQQQIASVSARDVNERVAGGEVLETFQFVSQARPDLMPAFVESVRQNHGDELAQQAVVAYQQLSSQQMQQSVEERMNDLETRITAPTVIRNGLDQMVGSLAEQYGGEDQFAPVAEALLGRVQQMAQNGVRLPADPDAVYNFLERNVLDIMREQITTSRNDPQGPQEVDTAALGETGGSKAPVTSPSDNEVEDLVSAFNEMKYGNHGPD